MGNGSGWLSTSVDYSDAGQFTPDRWHHIVYAINKTGWKIYYNGGNNGAPNAQGTWASNSPLLHDSNHDMYIGRYQFGAEQFNGVIDEVMVYKEEIDVAEVEIMYSVGKSRVRE